MFHFFFFNDTATTEIYTLSLHERSSDLVEPTLKTLAPKDGYAYVGGAGAGHFVKMVHNGVEYGMLQRSEEHTSELQSRQYLVCRLLLEKKKNKIHYLYLTNIHNPILTLN